jgi:hypothetical protein
MISVLGGLHHQYLRTLAYDYGQVRPATGKPVDLVNDYHVDQTVTNMIKHIRNPKSDGRFDPYKRMEMCDVLVERHVRGREALAG